MFYNYFMISQKMALYFIKPQSIGTLNNRFTQFIIEIMGHTTNSIDMDCGHYVHVYEPDFIADEIKKFIGELNDY